MGQKTHGGEKTPGVPGRSLPGLAGREGILPPECEVAQFLMNFGTYALGLTQ